MSLNFIELCGLHKSLITKLLGEGIVQISHKRRRRLDHDGPRQLCTSFMMYECDLELSLHMSWGSRNDPGLLLQLAISCMEIGLVISDMNP
jgi:hypothetical protein